MCVMYGVIYVLDIGKCVGGLCCGGCLWLVEVDECDMFDGCVVFWVFDVDLYFVMFVMID